MNNKWLFFNSLKLLVFIKIHTKTLFKPVDCSCWKVSSRMCSDVLTNESSNTSCLLAKILSPPNEVRGITRLDKSAFVKRVCLPAVFINGNHSIPDVLRVLKPYQVKLLNFKTLVEIESDGKQGANRDRAFVLNPDMIKSFDSFNVSVKNQLKELKLSESDFHYIERTINFDNWGIEALFRAILPENLNFSGYSLIGHIAHLNLNQELLAYKYVLGEVILSKVKPVKTVVNKVHIIENTFRNFQMELICGEDNMVTKLKENGCMYELDFAKVYWNSRLGSEHERIVQGLDKNDVLYDVFAGIGPFVIPAAKKGCLVVGNDLNPDAYKWLNHNVKLNKVSRNVICYNSEAKNFIQFHLKEHLLNVVNYKNTDPFKVHITMNLPACAVSFLNDFRGLVTEDESKTLPKDIICHLYCFIREDNVAKCEDKFLMEQAKEFVETHLQRKLNDSNLIKIVYVRKVAPNKSMFRVSFLFEPDFLIRKSVKRNNDCVDEQIKKKV